MKNISKLIPLVFFTSSIMLISCDNGSHISNDKPKLKNIAKMDSLQNMRVDSLSKIAWGDVKFGMSLKEVLKTKTLNTANIDKNIKNKNNAFQTLRIDSKTNIDGISSITAHIFKNRLYSIILFSPIVSAIYYDTNIKETVNHLKELVENKYGTPTDDLGFPDLLKNKPSKLITAYDWWIGDKYISIGVQEVKTGSEYWVICFISNVKETKPVDEYNKKIKNEEESKNANGF